MVALQAVVGFEAAIANMQWSLGPNSSPPLYYESFKNLQRIRNNKKNEIKFDFVNDIPGTVETLFPQQQQQQQQQPEGDDAKKRHFGLISLALILLGNGYTDECHNLVTPLSWPDDIHFAYGPSIYSQVSDDAKAYATYIHCLVHRKEAFNVGEFGMLGFENANYWSNVVTKMPGSGMHLPHEELLSATKGVVAKFGSCEFAQEWYERHDLSLSTTTFFESRAVHELCATVLKKQNQQQRKCEDEENFRLFAETIVETEMDVLLRQAMKYAGLSTQRHKSTS